MTSPNDEAVSLADVRLRLGLPTDGTGELLLVSRSHGDPIPPPSQWRLALGDWPEQWRDDPETAPRFLVMLRENVIATIEDIDPSGWGFDDANPTARVVPVRATAAATAEFGGRVLVADVTFGWNEPAERWALR
jgi:hypothetical protein